MMLKVEAKVNKGENSVLCSECVECVGANDLWSEWSEHCSTLVEKISDWKDILRVRGGISAKETGDRNLGDLDVRLKCFLTPRTGLFLLCEQKQLQRAPSKIADEFLLKRLWACLLCLWIHAKIVSIPELWLNDTNQLKNEYYLCYAIYQSYTTEMAYELYINVIQSYDQFLWVLLSVSCERRRFCA